MSDYFSHCNSEQLTTPEGFHCQCGMHHKMPMTCLKIGSGVINEVPQTVNKLGSKYPMVICASDTYELAAKQVIELLQKENIQHKLHILHHPEGGNLEPAEYTVGSVLLNIDPKCDLIIAVGSGVINDTGRLVATVAKIPQLTVGTAPSMDGYASASSSMVVNNIKQSLNLKAPNALLLDTDILKNAPMKMLCAGLGDILGKYTALCEWKLATLLRGEHYCKEVADLVEGALKKVVSNAKGLKERDPQAVEAVAEGLVLSGIGMAFVGTSRPASGLEHYFSHCFEMMALSRGKKYELHGLQVGLGTLYAVMMMEHLKDIHPTMERVEEAIAKFDKKAWEDNIRRVFGSTADGIIEMESRFKKNEADGRRQRAKAIIDNWDQIVSIIDSSIPTSKEIREIMEYVGVTTNYEDIDITKQDVLDAFVCSRDIRDKYLTSSMIWDIGYMDEFRDYLAERI